MKRQKYGKYREEVTDMEVTMRRSYICLIAVPEEEEKKKPEQTQNLKR